MLLTIGAGTGLLFFLRWFWWRISAFSEIAAMAVSFAAALYFQFADLPDWTSWQKLIGGIGVTTLGWLLATFVCPSTDPAVLDRFYERIRPGGPGWKPVRDRLGPGGANAWGRSHSTVTAERAARLRRHLRPVVRHRQRDIRRAGPRRDSLCGRRSDDRSGPDQRGSGGAVVVEAVNPPGSRRPAGPEVVHQQQYEKGNANPNNGRE